MLATRDVKSENLAPDEKKDFNYLTSQILALVKKHADNGPASSKDHVACIVLIKIFYSLFNPNPSFNYVGFVSARHIGDPDSLIFFAFDRDSGGVEKLRKDLKAEFVLDDSMLTLTEFFALTPLDVTNATYQDDAKALFSLNRYEYFFGRGSQEPALAIKVNIAAIFKSIWPAIFAETEAELAYSHNKVSDTLQAMFATVHINYREALPFSTFLLTDLVEKSQLANKMVVVQSELSAALLPPLWELVNGYLNVSSMRYSACNIAELKNAISATTCLQDNPGYEMSLPKKVSESSGYVQIVENYFNSLAPSSASLKPHDPVYDCHRLAITNKALLGSFFLADLKETIENHPGLVRSFKEKTLLYPVYVSLHNLALFLAGSEKLKVKGDLYDESTGKRKAVPNPHAVIVKSLYVYIKKEGLANEKTLRALIASVKKSDADYRQKLQMDLKESPHSFFKNATRKATEALQAFEGYSKQILEQVQKLENFVDNKFVKKIEELPDQKAMISNYF